MEPSSRRRNLMEFYTLEKPLAIKSDPFDLDSPDFSCRQSLQKQLTSGISAER